MVGMRWTSVVKAVRLRLPFLVIFLLFGGSLFAFTIGESPLH